ncbi:MAG: alpha/beta hydrolase [Actinobacteria bacterium]|nr:alpha/beta hydrolase [Actinomycetota bacterium]
MTQLDVRIDAAGCVLAGTYAEVPDPVAAALLITGSGQTDHNSDARLPGGRKLRAGITQAVAEALDAARVCTLRFDKRGVGASGGDYLKAGMDQRAADARAARDWLAAKTEGLPLLAIGHSEGTYYAGQLAADGQAAGAVLLSGSIRPGGEVLTWQTAQLAERLPTTTKLILRLMRTDVVRAQQKNQAKIMASAADVLRVQGTRVNARWVRDFVTYDPAPVLARITVPVLAITGAHDLQVPPEDVAAMGRLVRGPFEGHMVPDLSHLLRPDPDSLGPRGYRQQTRQPVSPVVLQLITTWLDRNWGQA